MDFFNKLMRVFQPPSAEVLAARQLAEAKRHLLNAHAYREEAEAMVVKYNQRIKRLTETLRNVT